MKKTLSLAAVMLLASTAAHAHVGGDHAHDALAGFAHPFTGADHLLAMVAVGIVATAVGGRMLAALPAVFVGAMVAGGAAGAAGLTGTGVEAGIALSLVVLGAVLALGRGLPARPALAMVAVFGAVHGMAHGMEMPAGASGAAYFVSFAAATALLHGAGILAGLRFAAATPLLRAAGLATLAFGVAGLTGAV